MWGHLFLWGPHYNFGDHDHVKAREIPAFFFFFLEFDKLLESIQLLYYDLMFINKLQNIKYYIFHKL